MAIELWSPFEDLSQWSQAIRRAMRGETMWMPSIEVFSKDNDLIVKAELPGVTKKDVDVSLTGNTLTISGERKMEEKIEEKNFYKMETSYGKFRRSITLPVEAGTEDIHATFKDGILTVTVKGAAAEVPMKKKIEIEEAA